MALAACSSSTPATDGGGADSGIPDGGCDTTLAVDPCPEGRYCTPSLDRYSTCQLPGELDTGCAERGKCGGDYCIPDAGCNAPGLVCQKSFPLEDGGAGTTSVCVYDCDQAADCPEVDTTCVNPPLGGHQLCYYNFCGPNAVPANGSDYYAPCDSGGPLRNDALCIASEDPSGAPIGRCYAGGSAPIGSSCQRTRTNGNTTAICEVGSLCFVGSSGASRCMQVCAATSPTAPDGGPGCPDPNDICFNDFTSWGYCVQKCSQTGGGSCPTGTQCSMLGQGIFGCLP